MLASGLVFAGFATSAMAQGAVPATAPAVVQNNAPAVGGIPPQTIDEKKQFETIKLDQFVNDPEDKPETMTWTVSGNKALIVTVTNRVATIKIADKYWNGAEALTFTAKDPKGATGSETVNFTVNSINDPPVFSKKIPDQTIDEGKSFLPIKLDEYIADPDHPAAQIAWSVSVDQIVAKERPIQGGELSVNIDANRIATIVIPDTNWFGAAKVTFTATDGEGASVSSFSTFAVRSVNDAPIIQKIPDQTIDEGGEFESVNLTQYVSDADNDPSTIKWTVAGGNQLKASIDKNNVLSIKIPNQEWNGTVETFTVTAKDPAGGQSSSTIKFLVKAVNDAPELKQIPSQTIDEGKKFAPIDLSKLVTDVDNRFDQLKWTITGQKALVVKQVGNNVEIAPPDTIWWGEETINFSVTDPDGAKAESQATFTVRSVNRIPVMKTIPDQTIEEGKKFTAIKLDDFITDADNKNSEIQWDASVKTTKKTTFGDYGELSVNIDANRVAIISIPDSNYNGAATITFTGTDPEGAKASKTANFTVSSVNDFPIIQKIADQNVDEGNAFDAVNLDQYVTDADNAITTLKWVVTGNQKLLVAIDKNRVLTVKAPDDEWGGEETLTLTTTDPEGGSASTKVKYSVKAINDAPEMKDIPSQSIKENEAFKPINLDEYVKDADNANTTLKFAVTGNKSLKVQMEGRMVKIAVPDSEWVGEEVLTFSATDPGNLKVERTATFAVNGINDAPQTKQIPDQTILEAKQFTAIKLDDFVFDPDNAKDQLSWEASVAKAKGQKGQAQLTVEIDAARVAHVVIPDTLWNGAETVTFTVTDPAGARKQIVTNFTVTAVNHAPTLTKIPDQTIEEHAEFATINLDEYVSDVDDSKDALKWTVEGGNQLSASIDKKRNVIIRIPSKQWNGSETFKFTATDAGGLAATASVKFTVTPINDPPVVKEIEGQSINAGQTFKPIAWESLVSDPDNAPNQLKWTITGNKALKVTMDAQHKVTITTPDTLWSGEETLTFTLNDGLTTVEKTALFTVKHVNHAPILQKIADQTIDEGKKFALIDLKKLVSDIDNKFEELTWSFTSMATTGKKETAGALQVAVENGIATVAIPDSLWNGAETITFAVSDPEGGKASQKANFTVKFINHVPTFQKIADQVVEEKSSFQPLNLGELVSDVDNAKNTLKVEVTGQKDLKVIVDKNFATTVTTPSKYWNGSEKLTFTVSDPLGAKTAQTATFTVKSVNDLPVIEGLKGQSIDEGKEFSQINLDAMVNDPDHPKEKLKWTVTGAKELKVTVDGARVVTIKTPNPDWNGAEALIFKVADPENGIAEVTANFEVRPVDDAPILKPVADQNIDEGKKFVAIDLNKLVSDVDNKTSELTWSTSIEAVGAVAPAPSKSKKKGAAPAAPVAVAGPNLSVDIQNGIATVVIPDSLWNGQRKITFTVSDPGGLKANSSAIFNVKHVNHAPTISKEIQGKVISVNEKEPIAPINLALAISDVDSPLSQLKIEVLNAKDLKVNIDKDKNLVVAVPHAQWNGKELLTLVVTDPEGARAETKLTYEVKAVNDAPVVSKFMNQTIKEHETFKPVNLDSLVADPDNKPTEIQWTVTGAKELKAEIARDRSLKVTIPSAQWNGSETLTLTAKDPAGAQASASAIFTVTAVNDAPVLSEFKAQTIKEHADFAPINLDDLVIDPDNKKSELVWSAVVTGGQVAAPTKKGAVAAPIGKDLTVEISPEHKATFVMPNDQWNGERSVVFTVADPAGLKDSKALSLKATAVNDAPVLAKIPDQTIEEKASFAPVNLLALVNDPDNAKETLVWTISGAKALKASIEKGILTVATPDKFWSGAETINVTVVDPSGAKAMQSSTFTVKAVNDAPVIGEIKPQTIDEGKTFELIDVTKAVSDPDNKTSELVWTHSEKHLKVEFNQAKQLFRIVAPDTNWFGIDTITFTVTDPAKASATKAVVFTVKSVNDAPIIAKIPDVTTKEAEAIKPIDISKFASDVDNKLSDLSYTIDDGAPAQLDAKGKLGKTKLSTVKHQMRFNLDEKGILHAFTPETQWFGVDIVKVNVFDPSGAKASQDIKFTVTAVNDAPTIIGTIEDQTTNEGTPFKPIKLDALVMDPDNKVHELTWTADDNRNLDVVITSGREALIKAKRPDYFGQDRINFTVKDPGGLKANISAVFTVKHVNSVPTISKIPDQTVNEDDSFKPIAMDPLVNDKDNRKSELRWDVSGQKELVVEINKLKGVIEITRPRQYWKGKPEVVTFKVTDPEGASATTTATFTSIPQNHPPVAMSHAYATKEGEQLHVAKEDGLLIGVTDPDDEKAADCAIVDRTQNGNVSVNPDGSFTYAPKIGFSGSDEFTFKVRDKQGAWSKPERVDIDVQFKMGELRSNTSAKTAPPAPAAAPAPAKVETKKKK